MMVVVPKTPRGAQGRSPRSSEFPAPLAGHATPREGSARGLLEKAFASAKLGEARAANTERTDISPATATPREANETNFSFKENGDSEKKGRSMVKCASGTRLSPALMKCVDYLSRFEKKQEHDEAEIPDERKEEQPGEERVPRGETGGSGDSGGSGCAGEDKELTKKTGSGMRNEEQRPILMHKLREQKSMGSLCLADKLLKNVKVKR